MGKETSMIENCPDRLTFARFVIESTTWMYSAKADLDAAKAHRPPDAIQIAKLSIALFRARAKGREAQRAFDKHIREHECRS
jgi:hypothetical protein